MLGYDVERVPLGVRRQMSVGRQNLLIGEFLRNVREPAQPLPDGADQLIRYTGVQIGHDSRVDTTTEPGDFPRYSNTSVPTTTGKRLSDRRYVGAPLGAVPGGDTVTDMYVAGNILAVEIHGACCQGGAIETLRSGTDVV
jgi:hypothetical protein